MKIVLFGTGKVYKEKNQFISITDKVIAFLDNDQRMWETSIDGVAVYNPKKILELSFDQVILMSDYALEMKKQLLELGCDRKKILHYHEYIDRQKAGELQMFFPVKEQKFQKKCCLIITTDLEYNGGSIAAYYAALALQREGYESVIAAPSCDPAFMKEIHQYGITVMIYKNLSHSKQKELFWTDRFEYVIVNTLQMSCCAMEIAKNRKVVLWIHEPHPHYESIAYWKDEIQEGILHKNLSVYGVSSVARDNFLTNFRSKQIEILPFGIPDEYQGERQLKNQNFTFAMIGAISEQKGQDIFLQAIQKMGKQRTQCTFLMIGKNLQDSCGQMIEEASHRYSNIQLLGEVSHKEVMRRWQEIDVLVVASREDTLSIVATEALMLGKVCIVSKAAGITKYITDYVDGFLFPSEGIDQLADKMLWCIEHEDMLLEIGRHARDLYKSNFSMEIFGEKLKLILQNQSNEQIKG